MILSARDISQKLSNQAEQFAKWIFPNGVKDGNNWCVGSVDGEAGKSLRVCISGAKAGIWADFSGNDKGDLLGLIASVRRVALYDAIKVAKEWLGIREPENVVPRKNYSKPTPKPTDLQYNSQVFKYLTDERSLNDDIIRGFKVFSSNNGEAIAFPSFSPDGKLENVSHIFLKRDNGKKRVEQEKGCAPALFGWQALPTDPTREIIICEGQIDAMSWTQVGYPCLSVPNGAENHNWIEYEWDKLQQFDTIWLAFDNDLSGKKAVKEVASRLGLHRCLVVSIEGCKDANEALQNLKVAAMRQAIANAKPMSPEQIRNPIEFRERVVEKFYPKDGVKPGFWPSMFDYELGLRPGEVTIWTGVSGHGKSVLLSQLICEAVLRGNRCAIASMEMRGEATLHRMISQSEISNSPRAEQIETILDWMGGKLWIYDIIGNVSTSKMLELMEYSSARHAVNHFVIDSLMKCGVGSDDYDAQRVFLNDLCSFAKAHDCHIHLVAHARKGKDESEKPGKLDVSGSSNIINQADNILSVWRNKDKEAKRYEKRLSDQDELNSPDAIVYCTKQRDSGDEFSKRMRYYKQVFRFTPLDKEDMQDISILKQIERDEQSLIPQYENGVQTEILDDSPIQTEPQTNDP